MNMARGSVWLSYLLVALVIVACVLSILARANDPIWARMPDARRNYDVISIGAITLGVVVTYGLWRNRRWGRPVAISFAAMALFMFVGIKLLAPLLTSGVVPIMLDWESTIMGILSIASIIALCHRSSRTY